MPDEQPAVSTDDIPFEPDPVPTTGTGLYCGEQDMFVFMVDPLGWTEINGEAFAPGFFLWNSEVGRRSVGVQTFWFQAVCANHIVWDATVVVEIKRKHTANVHESLNEIRGLIESLVNTRDRRLMCYRGRSASVAGDESRRGLTREQSVFGFAPESTGAPEGLKEDRFDILLCTDVLAEGMNLQQCRNVINYDLPWNPMRLVQRHGRIDRIGSRHREAFLRTFFPDRQLDQLLDLEMRVRAKLARAAASVGIEVSPIERGAEGQQSFTESREEIEKLHRGDTSIYEAGDTESAAQTGEEYRQELRKALVRCEAEIVGLPWKAGSGLAKGRQRGHFFCASVGDRIYLRFIPFAGSQTVSEIGTCLRLIECQENTERVMPDDLRRGTYSAWERARQHIFAAWNYETDPAYLQPKLRKLNRDVADFLRAHPPAGLEQARLDRCLDAVESPWSKREENLIRDVFTGAYASDEERARGVIEEVERTGLEPFQAPDALPPIHADDIHLICWMAIEADAV